MSWMHQNRLATADLFESHPAMPSGFGYRPDCLSVREQMDFISQFEKLPFRPFEFHGFFGNRRIVSYGFRYDYAGRVLRKAEEVPPFLYPLRQIAGTVTGISTELFQHVLVTEYAPGAGIGWHRDKPMFEDVVALSFLQPCVLRLRRKVEEKWLRASAVIEPRSCYSLRQAARNVWEHSLAPMERSRYSVTFRTFKRDFCPPK